MERVLLGGGFLLIGVLCAAFFLGINQVTDDEDRDVPPMWGPMAFLGAIVWTVLGVVELATGFLQPA